MLAARCDEVLSCDIAAAAVQAAARRTEDLAHVRVEQRDIPGGWPDGRFDLIVFSEILYYLGNQDLEQALKHAVSLLSRRAPCSPCTGGIRWPTTLGPATTSTRCWRSCPGLARLVRHDEPDFLAEVYIRTEGTPVSVAEATGLV